MTSFLVNPTAGYRTFSRFESLRCLPWMSTAESVMRAPCLLCNRKRVRVRLRVRRSEGTYMRDRRAEVDRLGAQRQSTAWYHFQVPIRDTTPEAQAVQDEIVHKMTGEQRVDLAFEMSIFARGLARAGIMQEHPDWTDSQIS